MFIFWNSPGSLWCVSSFRACAAFTAITDLNGIPFNADFSLGRKIRRVSTNIFASFSLFKRENFKHRSGTHYFHVALSLSIPTDSAIIQILYRWPGRTRLPIFSTLSSIFNVDLYMNLLQCPLGHLENAQTIRTHVHTINHTLLSIKFHVKFHNNWLHYCYINHISGQTKNNSNVKKLLHSKDKALR